MVTKEKSMCESGGTNCNHQQAHREYDKALRQAFWTGVNHRIRNQCHDLLPFASVWQHVQTAEQQTKGIDEVEIDSIVGSSGRYRDFDLSFLPRRREYNDRWVNIAQAHYDGAELPPVQLYRIGSAYYVEDGNHRVSVARIIGLNSIKANIIEIDASNLSTEPRCTRSGYKI
jgi:hypothetical protein